MHSSIESTSRRKHLYEEEEETKASKNHPSKENSPPPRVHCAAIYVSLFIIRHAVNAKSGLIRRFVTEEWIVLRLHTTRRIYMTKESYVKQLTYWLWSWIL